MRCRHPREFATAPARRWSIVALACVFVLLLVTPAASQEDISREGGDSTTDNASSEAYNQMLPEMGTESARLLHEVGESGFLRDFGKVPIRGKIRVGPKFNSSSCFVCHTGNGRGGLSLSARGKQSDTVVKVSREKGSLRAPHAPPPVPGIGLQIRDHALRGATPDAKVSLIWNMVQGEYGDGSPYELRKPTIKFSRITQPGLRAARTSLRRAPPIFGSGLLDNVPKAEIEQLADPSDQNQDGISGRPNYVWSVEHSQLEIGRFGFKAGSPSLRQQVAAAYATDMGVTNPLFRESQVRPDITGRIMDATIFYSGTLGVPRARDQQESTVQNGRALFDSLGCSSCHVTTLHTGASPVPSLSNQEFHPFTDLLLHDMGAELADNRPEFVATGQEWRTTPLWGIGLADVVLGAPATYLHDGRAQNLEEAVLWHGGEALQSREAFRNSPLQDREDLVRFLRSL